MVDYQATKHLYILAQFSQQQQPTFSSGSKYANPLDNQYTYYRPRRVDTTNRPFVHSLKSHCIDDTPILRHSKSAKKMPQHDLFSSFAINGEILHIHLVYLFAGRTNTLYPSIWIGSMVCCCDTRTTKKATFSSRQLPINQHQTSTTANSATKLANKRRRLAFSIHTLSFCYRQHIIFFAHAELNLVTRNNRCVPAGIVHTFLQHFPKPFPSVHTKRSRTNTTTSLFPCLLIVLRTSFSMKSR